MIEKELSEVFASSIQDMAETLEYTYEKTLQLLKVHYDGYLYFSN